MGYFLYYNFLFLNSKLIIEFVSEVLIKISKTIHECVLVDYLDDASTIKHVVHLILRDNQTVSQIENFVVIWGICRYTPNNRRLALVRFCIPR